jgi:hypothetical protein
MRRNSPLRPSDPRTAAAAVAFIGLIDQARRRGLAVGLVGAPPTTQGHRSAGSRRPRGTSDAPLKSESRPVGPRTALSPERRGAISCPAC